MSQDDLFVEDAARNYELAGGAQLIYLKSWLDKKEADDCFARLEKDLPWEQPEVTVYGKKHRIPRLQSWHGDSEAIMLYSGTRFFPQDWHPKLQRLRISLEAQCNAGFNSVLANLYRDGSDGMGWHSDNEPELGDAPTIASLSLGEERSFALRLKKNAATRALSQGVTEDRIKIVLAHGDLLIMKGETQRHWEHSVAKTKTPKGPRINLTYRFIRHPV